MSRYLFSGLVCKPALVHFYVGFYVRYPESADSCTAAQLFAGKHSKYISAAGCSTEQNHLEN